jgi:hypothetical protein
VPPETLQPVVRQLVDSFCHDKARPEVMTVGLKTVREICMRAPLVMSEELLQVGGGGGGGGGGAGGGGGGGGGGGVGLGGEWG